MSGCKGAASKLGHCPQRSSSPRRQRHTAMRSTTNGQRLAKDLLRDNARQPFVKKNGRNRRKIYNMLIHKRQGMEKHGHLQPIFLLTSPPLNPKRKFHSFHFSMVLVSVFIPKLLSYFLHYKID